VNYSSGEVGHGRPQWHLAWPPQTPDLGGYGAVSHGTSAIVGERVLSSAGGVCTEAGVVLPGYFRRLRLFLASPDKETAKSFMVSSI